MAESQESPGAGTDPGTGTADAAGLPTEGTQATAGSDQVIEDPSQSQPSEELDEIRRTVSAGGEKAVQMFVHQQQVASRHGTELAKFKPLEDLVAEHGADAVRQAWDASGQAWARINAHPQAAEAVNHFVRTGEWKMSMAQQPDDPDYGYEDEPTPEQKEIATLKDEVRSLRGDGAAQKMKTFVGQFFGKDMGGGVTLGQVLTDEQKSRALAGLEKQIQGLQATDSGQQTLRSLDADMVKRMLQLQIPLEEWAQVGETAHLRKIELKKDAATGAAPAGGTTGNEERAYSDDLTTAVAEFAKEEGIDLYNLP